MKHLLRLPPALALAVALVVAAPGAADEDKEKKADPYADLIGKPAPDLKGTSLGGEPVKLSDLKGKVVLVDFWAVWCGPCVATFPHLRDWNKEYHDKGLEILGVTTYYERFGFDKEKGKLTQAKLEKDENTGKAKLVGGLNDKEERSMLKDFTAHHKREHRIMVLSKEGWTEAGTEYKVRGIPTAVLIDRKGKVRMVKVGSGEANANALEKEIKKLLAE